jgi:hypothetical protein
MPVHNTHTDAQVYGPHPAPVKTPTIRQFRSGQEAATGSGAGAGSASAADRLLDVDRLVAVAFFAVAAFFGALVFAVLRLLAGFGGSTPSPSGVATSGSRAPAGDVPTPTSTLGSTVGESP